MRDCAAVLAHAEEAHVGMPHGHVAGPLLDCHAEEAFGESEQALQHVGEVEVLHQLLLRVGVELLALAFAPVRDVPGLDFFLGERGERVVLARLDGLRGGGQLVLHRLHRRDGRRALRGERVVGVGLEPEQARHLLSQREDAVDERRVVERARRGARGAGAQERLAHGTVAGVLHEREVDGLLDRRLPRPLLRVAVARHHRLQLRGQTLHLGRRGEREGKSLRRVEHVVAEVAGELGELGHDLVEALLALALEGHAGEFGVLRHLGEDAAADGRLRGRLLRELVEAPALPHAQRERHQVGLEALVHLPPRLAVQHAHEVRDDSPGEPQGSHRVVERAHEAVPRGRRVVLQRVDGGLRVRQQFRQRLLGRRRRHRGEVGELRDVVEWVHVGLQLRPAPPDHPDTNGGSRFRIIPKPLPAHTPFYFLSPTA